MIEKIVCKECGWKGHTDEVLIAPHPFATERDEIVWGCPKCRSVGCFRTVCDEPDCWEEDTCGTPTPKGYRRTCGEHMPKP